MTRNGSDSPPSADAARANEKTPSAADSRRLAAASADDDFGSRAARGGMITIGGQAAKVILNAAGIFIMARLLLPQDFGLIAMVVPIVDLVTLFQDFGLSSATIQRHRISDAQSSNLFWFNVAASALLAAVVMAMSPLVAAFYGDPRLTWVTVAFGGLVLCSGLTAQHLALLNRRMLYSRLVMQDVGALLISLIVGIVAAWYGLSYWALILAMASRSVALLVFVWIAAEWLPKRPSRRSGVRPLLRFGRDLTLTRFGTFLIENMDSVLIGRVWGGYSLGLYDRAYSLLKLYKQVNGPVNTVANSVLSRLQHQPARFRHYYVKGLGLVTGLSMPLMAFLAANAADVVRVALGPKWLGVVPIFLALVPAAFIGTVKPATFWMYISLGRTDRQLRWTMFVQMPFTLASYVVGLPYGPLGVALAYSIVAVILRPLSILYCLRDFKQYIRMRHVLEAILPAAFASIAAGLLQVGMLRLFLPRPLHPIPAIAVDAGLYGILFVLLYCAMPIGRRNVATYVTIARRALGRNGSAPLASASR